MRRLLRLSMIIFLIPTLLTAQTDTSATTPTATGAQLTWSAPNHITAGHPGASVRFSVTNAPAGAESIVIVASDGSPIAALSKGQVTATALMYGVGKHLVRAEIYDGKGKLLAEPSAVIELASDIKPVDNGITVGVAKQFDDRSLVAMLRDIEAALQTQQGSVIRGLGDTIGRVQGQTVDRSFFGASASTLPIPGVETTTGSKITDTGSTASNEVKTEQKPDATTTTTTLKAADPSRNVETTSGEKVTQAALTPQTVQAPPATSATFTQTTLGIQSGDLLAEQTNLAAQYVNLRLLLQRSLSDRVVIRSNGTSQHRSQPVYGFQISIDPPPQYRDAVAEAVVTIAAPEDDQRDLGAPRLVTLLPKEKTYNVAAVTNRARAFSLGAIVQVVNAGVAFNNSRETLYVVKDTDTVALEKPVSGAAGRNSVSFAWQFRPVLGNRVVEPGTRQVFAVLALPTTLDEPWDGVVSITTRWRKYNRKTKTAGAEIRDSTNVQEPYRVSVSRLFEQEQAVASAIENLDWREAGAGAAIVTVNGHFPEGTRVSVADSIIDQPTTGMLLQTPRRISFIVSAERLFFSPALVDAFGVATPLLKPMHEQRPSFTVVGAGPEKGGFAVYLQRQSDARRTTAPSLALLYDQLRMVRSDDAVALTRPLVLIGHTVFGFANAPIKSERAQLEGCKSSSDNAPLCDAVSKATAPLTKLVFDVPKTVLQDARVVRVIDPFVSDGEPAQGVITFPKEAKTISIGDLQVVGFNDANTQFVLSGKALNQAANLKLRVGATPCSLLEQQSESLALFSCPATAVDNAARAIVTLDGQEPKLLDLPALPSSRVRITGHEPIREGEARPVRLDGNDLSSVTEARYNGIPMRITRERDFRSVIFVDVPSSMTSSPGEKIIQLTLADGRVLRTALTVSAKPNGKS